MRKISLYIATSLDGYIADKNGSVNWLQGDGSDEKNQGTYPDFIDTIDTVILGYSTYNQIVTELSPNDWVYKGKKSYVLTHREKENTNEIIFTNEKIETLISNLKNEEGKDIWICGGASIVNQLIKLDLIDSFHIAIIPTILGNGIKLFDNFEEEKKLTLISTETYNGIVELIYKRK